MKIPTLTEAEELIAEAEQRNPGLWVSHSRYAAEAAQAIASYHPELDADKAYILGLLHDIGRYFGVTGMRHSLDGYLLLLEKGFDDAAPISITHSYVVQDISHVNSAWDGTEEELKFMRNYITNIKYSKYDRLIQLCDGISLPTGHCLIEKRMVDVALRYGTSKYSVPRWKAFFKIKEDFEKEIGCSIYSLLPNIIENTFGFMQ
ncbi:MAG: HD domain-containing protein [Anaerolineae bacterium]|jgi:hypothetical protein|nr:HD domain-containing protein [Anaerolineae bacterium]MBT7073985.1 HD domain-containing protein [Anaerolineae bacterium]MBT7782301.1 HD domain-containing protein [Anaerolineae bacterium]